MLSSDDLKALGIKPGEVFGRILRDSKSCDTKEEALEKAKLVWQCHLDAQAAKPKRDKVFMKPGTAWHYLSFNPCLDYIASREIAGQKASNGERRRWLLSKSVLINGGTPGPDDPVGPTVWQLIFFPSGGRITMLDYASCEDRIRRMDLLAEKCRTGLLADSLEYRWETEVSVVDFPTRRE